MNKKLIMALIATWTLSTSTFAFWAPSQSNMGGINSSSVSEHINETSTFAENPANQAKVMANETSTFAEGHAGQAKVMANETSTFAEGHAGQAKAIANEARTFAENHAGQARKKFREEKKELKTQFQWERSKFKDNLKKVKTLTKSEIKDIKKEYKPQINQDWKELPSNVKVKIKDIKKEYLPKLKSLRNELKNTSGVERKTIITQFKQLKEKLHTQINTLASGTKFIKDLEAKSARIQEQRQKMLAKIKEQKDNFKKVKTQFKDSRETLVVKWKKAIISKLSSRINNMSLTKLEKISNKIDKVIPHLENRKNLSNDKKEEIVSALDALKQVINIKIAELKVNTPITNLDLLN